MRGFPKEKAAASVSRPRGRARGELFFALTALLCLGNAAVPPPAAVPDWQRLAFEEKLLERINRSVGTAVKRDLFVASVSLKLLPPPPEAEKKDKPAVPGDALPEDRVFLEKLDVETDLIGAELPGVPVARPVSLLDAIDQVSVGILLDQTVFEPKKDVIEKIVKSVVGPLGKSAVEIKVEKANLFTPPIPSPKPEPVKEKEWDAKRWAIEFKQPLGLFGAAVIIALFASLTLLLVTGGFKRVESRKVAVMEARNAREAAQAATEAERALAVETASSSGETAASRGSANGVSHEATHAGVSIEGAQKGMDRFRALLAESPESAISLVREWIRAPGRATGGVLGLLSRVLSADELSTLLARMNPADRKEWKRILGEFGGDADLAAADAYLASQVVESMLSPSQSVTPELQEMLSQLSLPGCVTLASEDPEVGAVLASVLPTAQVARMLALLTPEQATTVAKASLKLSAAEIVTRAASLPRKLAGVKKRDESTPFMERTAELLKDIGPAKEQLIFNALAEAGEDLLLEATARRFFPGELLFTLPPGLLKSLLDRLPVPKRAELIASLEPGTQAALLDASGAAGSKARELLDSEIEELNADELRKKRVERNREKIFTQFLGIARATLRGSEAASEQAETALLAWLGEKSGGRIKAA